MAAGQHHLSSPYTMLQPLPLPARLAPAPGEMLPAGLVIPVAPYKPVVLAEEVATSSSGRGSATGPKNSRPSGSILGSGRPDLRRPSG